MAHDNVLLEAITRAGIDFTVEERASFLCMDEANQLQVTDNVLTDMMKFITDKYNSIDFREIEKSAGDFSRFRYTKMIMANVHTLIDIYKNTQDPGAEKYLDVLLAISRTADNLTENKRKISELYKLGDGLTQIMYTSLVTSMISCIGILVSNTIRFVTTEQTADCEVLFDEIPNTFKHVHIKNMMAAGDAFNSFNAYMNAVIEARKNGPVNETVSFVAIAGVIKSVLGAGSLEGAASAIAAGVSGTAIGSALATAGTALAVVVAIVLCYNFARSVIYAFYFARVKISEYLAQQEALVRTNIEALQNKGADSKVIARQKRWADILNNLSKKIGVKNDTAEANARAAKKKEDDEIKKKSGKSNSPASDSGVML